MFSTSIGRVVAMGVLGAGALLAGFQSTARAAAPASCSKCTQVWETTPASNGHGTPTRTQVMKCEDCTNAVTNFLTKGELKHVCTTCGDQVSEMCAKH